MVASAPTPADEAARLASLRGYGVLNTPPDERFDLFTRLSTWLYDVPLSAINLIDEDNTFFKSLIGMDSYLPRRATSICAHAVGEGEPIMVVEDLLSDSRFHDHPLVVKKGFRFYAGAVLWSDTGHALGTLCVCDTQPRSFSDEERGKLLELGRGVSAVLELHRANIRLREVASRDVLTGLLNRRGLTEALDAATATEGPEPFAVLCFDMDNFKQVNDRYGHAGGDALLCAVAQRLRGAISPTDIPARLGGDEFVVLLRQDAPARRVRRVAAGILEAFGQPFAIKGQDVPIRASIGVALWPENAPDAVGVMRCADDALYEAKRSGRGRVCFYNREASGSAKGTSSSHSRPAPDYWLGKLEGARVGDF